MAGAQSPSHAKRHGIDSIKDHKPVAGATGNNLVVIDPLTLLPTKDSLTSLSSILGGLIPQGIWDASVSPNGSPALNDGTGTLGHFYIVIAAGSRDLGSGITQNFEINDWVMYDQNDDWIKIENSEPKETEQAIGYYVSNVRGTTAALGADGSLFNPYKDLQEAIDKGVANGDYKIIIQLDTRQITSSFKYSGTCPTGKHVSINAMEAIRTVGPCISTFTLGDGCNVGFNNIGIETIKSGPGVTACNIRMEECLISTSIENDTGGPPTAIEGYFTNTIIAEHIFLNDIPNMAMTTGHLYITSGSGNYLVDLNLRSQNNNKIIDLANGTAPTDGMTFGQKTVALPANAISIIDTDNYFHGTEVEAALQENGKYLTNITENVALLNITATPTVSSGVFTLTIVQNDGKDLEFNINKVHLKHSSDTMTVIATSYVGTDANPKTIYVYVDNHLGIPRLVASNTSPEGVVAHVHIGTIKAGSITTSPDAITIYGGYHTPITADEIISLTYHRFLNDGAHYLSGMTITAIQTNLTIGAGTMGVIFESLSTVEKVVGTDGLFVIDSAGVYTSQTDFAFTEYSTGETITADKFYNVVIGYVWSSAGSGKLIAIIQKGDTIPSGKEYKNTKEAIEDKYGTLTTRPADDLINNLFVPVCRIVIKNDANDYLQELPEAGTGLYAIDLRGSNGGGGGSVSTANNTEDGNVDSDTLFWNNTLGVYEPKTIAQAKTILGIGDIQLRADITSATSDTPIQSEFSTWNVGDRGIGIGQTGRIFMVYKDGASSIKYVELS